jgi:hypothetical protein
VVVLCGKSRWEGIPSALPSLAPTGAMACPRPTGDRPRHVAALQQLRRRV